MEEAEKMEVGDTLDGLIGVFGHELLGDVAQFLAFADDFAVLDGETTVGENRGRLGWKTVCKCDE